jgi:hypothetical protein
MLSWQYSVLAYGAVRGTYMTGVMLCSVVGDAMGASCGSRSSRKHRGPSLRDWPLCVRVTVMVLESDGYGV